jgi:hypothetical protein
MFTVRQGDRHYLLPEALSIYAQRGPLHDQTPWSEEIYQHCHQNSSNMDRWSMYLISYLLSNARMLFGECGSMSMNK